MPDQRSVVLVVEDQPLIRMAAVGMVEEAGFEAVDADSAEAAITVLSSRTDVRLVLTDVEMPGTMDGVGLAYYVRDRWPSILLMVASGRRILAECDLPSGSSFFSKPYDDAKLVATMSGMLAAAPLGSRVLH